MLLQKFGLQLTKHLVFSPQLYQLHVSSIVLLLSSLSLHLYHQKGKGSLQLPVCNASDEEVCSVLLMLTNTMTFGLDRSESLVFLFRITFKLCLFPIRSFLLT